MQLAKMETESGSQEAHIHDQIVNYIYTHIFIDLNTHFDFMYMFKYIYIYKYAYIYIVYALYIIHCTFYIIHYTL